MPRHILVVDTPAGDLADLVEAFRAVDPSSRVQVAVGPEELRRRLSAGLPPDLIVIDYLLGDGRQDGPALLAAARALAADVPIVAAAQEGDVHLAAEAVRAGATDFLVRTGQLRERVRTLMSKVGTVLDLMDRNRLLREQNRLLRQADQDRYRILGESPAIREVLARIVRVARIPRPVLVVGERGTGKELVARAIHAASEQSAGPFVVVNCAAFPDALLESELFGHEKGSFTGAETTAHGRFEQADGGTLFLDEIAHMSLPFQQKILRVVEYGTFTRVGGTAEIHAAARIVAATNADLRDLIGAGRFLPDLHDRLAFEEIRVPPLRERRGDVTLLARAFLEGFMREIPSLGGKRLSEAAIAVLERYHFPGNVRELKNIIERAAYRDTTNELTPEDIGMLPPPSSAGRACGFQEQVDALKRRLIRDALDLAGGNQAQAARLLNLSYHQFRYYCQRYGRRPSGAPPAPTSPQEGTDR